MYFLTFEAKPSTDNSARDSVGGAFINCWIVRPTLAEADAVARQMIAECQWEILERTDGYVISRSNQAPDGLEYYEQALIDHEVPVFYWYPVDSRE